MLWLYKNHKDWERQVQVFPMRFANSFPPPSCGEEHRAQYHEGDMMVHCAGYRQRLHDIWPGELEKWRKKGELVEDVESDILVR
jgi:hypothetical protein